MVSVIFSAILSMTLTSKVLVSKALMMSVTLMVESAGDAALIAGAAGGVPEIEIADIDNAAVPELLRVTVSVLVCPTTVAGKLTPLGVARSQGAKAVPVKVTVSGFASMLSCTLSVALRVVANGAIEVGVNIIPIAQVALPPTPVPQVLLLTAKSPAFGPVIAMPVPGNVTCPPVLLASVTGSAVRTTD